MYLKHVQPIKKKLAEKAFSSKDPYQICDALLRVTYYENDWRWVQKKCIFYLNSKDIEVKKLAITCIGHLARIHHALDTEIVLPLLKGLLNDPNVGGQVEDALDDINMFIGKA